MARWSSIKSLADIERRIAQGRGSGEGEQYRPWLYVHEVSSRGRSHKIPGVKIHRTHHLLSDLEAHFLRLAEFSQRVTDIREQFPLLPYGTTSDIASQLDIRHPRDPGANVDKVMTTDVLLTFAAAPPQPSRLVAFDLKYAKELSDYRSLEKLEIARRFWRERNTPWFLVTERDLPKVLCANLNWLWTGAKIDEHLQDRALQDVFVDELLARNRSELSLGEVINEAAAKLDIPSGDGCFLFKHLAWTHVIELDLMSPIKLRQPLKKLAVPVDMAHHEVLAVQEAL